MNFIMHLGDITADDIIATVICMFFAWVAITSSIHIAERKAQRRKERAE